ncbi:hypothetical protein AB0G73_30400 [Streptomyces sp. NPDC020719]|uniref:hypothetical protein n=1 Tax=unclassified Streptomyces TaxID=2593676 RepID=UPI0033ED0FC9
MIPMDQYKAVLAEAEHAAALLRNALTRVGITESQAARVRPLVASGGRGYVELGALGIADAHRLLDALRPGAGGPDGGADCCGPGNAEEARPRGLAPHLSRNPRSGS